MSHALDHVNCRSQELIPQHHFIQSILEDCLSPLLSNFYNQTLGGPLTPGYSETERGYLSELKESFSGASCPWLKEPVEEGKVDGSSALHGGGHQPVGIPLWM